MAAVRALPALAAALLLAAAGQASKYSREANEGLAGADGKRREAGEFRVVRLNQIWEKAQRVSGAARGDGGARRQLRGRARPLQTLIPRQGDGEERGPVCEERPRLPGPGSGLRWLLFCSRAWLSRPSRSERSAQPRCAGGGEQPCPGEEMCKASLFIFYRGWALKALCPDFHFVICVCLEFEEPRVIDLWDMAKSANFTEKELESFREELKHFEAKIEKHHHYQKQLEISHQKLKHVEGTGDKDHLNRNKEKYAMLQEKTKELGYKVKKHLQDLSSRISQGLQHNEL
ncbi:alpha-2-macroglobulin receptor-associated protein [Passer montanus]|uniref:alpha-2-macroglobulin receptor-associated protein n=1 Tax=Passer montanus TaxID=9160 RepID=UPI001960A839|nr:alpha-2-macroglobulin receptor-associated protein [Passer montanus]